MALVVLVIASGVVTARALLDAPPGAASGGPGVVVGGALHSCALNPLGHIWCWGYNGFGQLGTSDTALRNVPAFASAVNGADGAQHFMALAIGAEFSCAITQEASPGAGGAVRCWGRNDVGQLGDGTTTDRLNPVTPTGLGASVRSISAANRHACAIKVNNELWCWGNNTSGEVGNGTISTSGNPAITTPARVLGPAATALEVSAGYVHTCATLTNGSARCWGDNAFGQLGMGVSTPDMPFGVPVSMAGVVAHLAAGETVTCAAMANGSARCWGQDLYGALGRGVGNGVISVPVDVKVDATTSLTGVSQISAGRSTACVLAGTTAAIACWGLNTSAETGTGDLTNRVYATFQAAAPSTPTSLGSGWNHSCAFLANSKLQCWGYGGFGQLGRGSGSNAPNPVLANDVPLLMVSSAALAFTTRIVNTSSVVQTLTLTNASFGPLSLAEPYDLGGHTHFTTTDTCVGDLALGQSCEYAVTFHPVSTTGPWNGTLHLNAVPAAAQIVNLTGAAVADVPPAVTVPTAAPMWTAGGAPVQLAATATGSDPSNLTYAWSAPGAGVIGTTPQLEVAPQISTTYTLTVTDSGSPTAVTTKTINVPVFTGNTAAYSGGSSGYPTLQQYTGLVWEPQPRGANQSASADFVPVTGPSCGSACAAQGVALKGQLSSGPNAAAVLNAWVQVTWVSSTNEVLVRSVFRDGLLYRTPKTVTVDPNVGVVTGIDASLNGSTVSVTVRGSCSTCTQSFTATLPAALTVLGEPQWPSVPSGRAGFWGKNTTPGGLQITRFQSSDL